MKCTHCPQSKSTKHGGIFLFERPVSTTNWQHNNMQQNQRYSNSIIHVIRNKTPLPPFFMHHSHNSRGYIICSLVIYNTVRTKDAIIPPRKAHFWLDRHNTSAWKIAIKHQQRTACAHFYSLKGMITGMRRQEITQ